MALPNELHPLQLGAGSAESFQIQQSLRFNDGDSSYLQLNGGTSPTDGKIATYSVWVKRSEISTNDKNVFGCAPASTLYNDIKFDSNDRLYYRQYHSSGGAALWSLTTAARYRDTSAWLHIVVAVDTTQATSSDRVKMYVNGERITEWSSESYPGQNQVPMGQGGSYAIGIGRLTTSFTHYFDGYMAEYHYVDGTAYGPTDFGEYDANGVWRPIEVKGLTYGNRGFYLKFDSSAANGLGHDHSGNGNHFTANGLSSMDDCSDTPTNNWCTLNYTELGASGFSNGNLIATANGSSSGTAQNNGDPVPTMYVDSGKWYAEVEVGAIGEFLCGVYYDDDANKLQVLSYYYRSGSIYIDGSGTVATATGFSGGALIGIYLDMDAQTIQYSLNGVLQDQARSYAGSSNANRPLTITFGQGSSSGSCTGEFNYGQFPWLYPPGTSTATGAFNTVLYSGTSATKSVTGVGFQPDIVLIKARNSTGNWNLFDSVRGVGKQLYTNLTEAEGNFPTSGITSFDTDGFSLGNSANSDANISGTNYAAWCWKAGDTASSNTDGTITSSVSANPATGVSVGTFTGTGSPGSIGHGLGSAPKFIIIKRTDVAGNSWAVYHDSVGPNKQLLLNSTNAISNDTNGFPSAPTDTVINVGSGSAMDTNQSGDHVFYAFAEVEGISKMIEYDGNGSSQFIELGFKPAVWIYKCTNLGDSNKNWSIYDTARGDYQSLINKNNAESAVGYWKSVDNGLILDTTDGNHNGVGNNFILVAFAENFVAGDFKPINTTNLSAPTIKDGSKHFNPVIYAPDGSSSFAVTGVGFQPDLVWVKSRSYAEDHQLNDAVRGATKGLQPNLANGETTQTNGLISFDTDGFTVGNLSDYNYNGDSIISWNWLAGNSTTTNTDGSITSTVSVNATAGFSIVSYIGTGANATVGHGLGVAPDFIFTKIRHVGTNWAVWHKDLVTPTTGLLEFTSGSELNSATYWNSTIPSSTTVSLGTYGGVNTSSEEHIMYCFTEVDGYSKIGRYIGTGGANGPLIHCGFKPAYVLIKLIGTNHWIIFDSARDSNNVLNGKIEASTYGAEYTGADWLDFVSNGFKIRTSHAQVNSNGTRLIYIAFAEHPFGGDGVSPVTAR